MEDLYIALILNDEIFNFLPQNVSDIYLVYRGATLVIIHLHGLSDLLFLTNISFVQYITTVHQPNKIFKTSSSWFFVAVIYICAS